MVRHFPESTNYQGREVKREGKFKISLGELRKWLSAQEIYTKHKPIRRTFKRARVIAPRKFYQFDGDTVNMTRYEKFNGGYKFILVLIDVFTRFVWTFPLKTLTAREMLKTFKRILPGLKLEKLRTDHGSEFMNGVVNKYLASLGIDHFSTLNEKKANYAERVIQTLKTKLTKAINYARKREWISLLPAITESYNATYHRSIKMSPREALKSDDTTLWNIQYLPKPVHAKREPAHVKRESKNNKTPRLKSKFKLKIGDEVRLSFLRTPFERAYDEKWTTEVFTIIGREIKQAIPRYRIKDFNNEVIKGMFYGSELQKVELPSERSYNIEKILQRKTLRGEKLCLVRWEGYSKKFDSWISASKVKSIGK